MNNLHFSNFFVLSSFRSSFYVRQMRRIHSPSAFPLFLPSSLSHFANSSSLRNLPVCKSNINPIHSWMFERFFFLFANVLCPSPRCPKCPLGTEEFMPNSHATKMVFSPQKYSLKKRLRDKIPQLKAPNSLYGFWMVVVWFSSDWNGSHSFTGSTPRVGLGLLVSTQHTLKQG